MGTGKTSTLVLPNLYTLANEELSFVVTDTSGELYEQSSQYLADKGFNIVTFNLMDVHASERYNPLANLNTYTDVAQAAHVIIGSALSAERGDPFWSSGAEELPLVLITCLKNRTNAAECNLSNLTFPLTNFQVYPSQEASRI